MKSAIDGYFEEFDSFHYKQVSKNSESLNFIIKLTKIVNFDHSILFFQKKDQTV